MKIVEFIRARLAEDEEAARAAGDSRVNAGRDRWQFDAMQVRAQDRLKILVVGHTWPREGAHIARHDPARVLRQCAGLRRVFDEEVEGHVHLEGAGQTFDHEEANESTIFRGLASVWSDHPDYQSEWARG